jgi:tetraacyldisaccharide 4'-kinase
LLREPVGSLRRGDLVVLSRADLVDASTRLRIRRCAEDLSGPLRWVEARQAPRDLVDGTGATEGLGRIADARVAAFCGIGNPDGFRRTIEPLARTLVGFRTFSDHHPYSAGDVADLAAWSRDLAAELALTTQKDLVKLRTPSLGEIPLRALRIGLEVLEGEGLLDSALDRVAQQVEGA